MIDKGCEFCKGSHVDSDGQFKFAIDLDYLALMCTFDSAYFGISRTAGLEINFCPMCGTKLGGSDE